MDRYISIITPIFRVEQSIERCAESLFNQTYLNIEYIFIDDASDDRSLELLNNVIERFPNRKPFCKIIRHENNKGLAAARNTGLLHATGQYIWHIDSDDEISNDAVDLLLETAFRKNADIVLFDVMEVFETKMHPIKNSLPDSAESETILTLTRQKRFELCFRLIRRSLYDGINMDFSISMGEDWATTPRLSSRATTITYIDKILYYYYRNSTSMTGSFSLKNVESLLRAEEVLYIFFSGTKYAKYLPVSKAFLKVHLLKMTQFSNEVFCYVFHTVFKSIQCSHHDMSFPNRLILMLTNHNKLWLTKKYINLSCKIAKTIKF